MYADPKLAAPLLKQMRKLTDKQSKLTRGSDEWNELCALKNTLRIEWAILRILPDPKALTYKE